MSGKAKKKKNRAAKQNAAYAPSRPARLQTPAEPPPMPRRFFETEGSFGAAPEDGLRMLAALETLTSLEPDFSDEVAAEAAVTIIEVAGEDVIAEAMGRTAPMEASATRMRCEPPPFNGYESFFGPGDEAEVEIIEVAGGLEDPDTHRPPAASKRPASLTERISLVTGSAAGRRFLKALSGES